MSGLLYFILAFALLALGYVFYGRFAERVYGPKMDAVPPSVARYDGVDYVPMPRWRVFLIQLLNIAGLGPVFGALSGALYGPAALLWIVVGCIAGGAVHDYLAAMLSVDHGGENLPETMGRYLGGGARHVLRVLCAALCVLVGVVFTMGPAAMLGDLFHTGVWIWCAVIFGYYFLATLLPIQTLIGRLYPFFGALFIFMAVGVLASLLASGTEILPDRDFFTNAHPRRLPLWPMLFVTIACGAISGFHATQSPLMARCLPGMRDARPVFYGGMIAEGFIALIWATVGLSFRTAAGSGLAELTLQNPSLSVTAVCTALLGRFGAVLAVLGVVVLPVTSGDTAFRCARLMLSDMFRLEQRRLRHRLMLAVPLFAVSIVLTQVNFQVIWRYFGWFNQVIAAMTLWMIAAALRSRRSWHWIATVPAALMTVMCVTYLLCAPECLALPVPASTAAGVLAASVFLGVLLRRKGAASRQEEG